MPIERRALRILRIAGTLALALGVAMLMVAPLRPVRANVPGFTSPVVGFELASEPAHVLDILGAPADPERAEAVRRMDLVNRIDFLFMLAYPAIYAGIALLLSARGHIGHGVAALLVGIAALMWLGDLLENRQLLALSAITDPEAMRAPLDRLRSFTLLKWHALFGASAVVAVAVWRDRSWWRWSAAVFAGAAVIGFASLAYLPAIEWSSFLLGLAWLWTWAHALAARAQGRPAR